MNIEQKENYILISQKEVNFDDFLSFFKEKHQNLTENNIFVQLFESINITEEKILLFLDYAEMHEQNGTSFVVICSSVNVDKFPETFNVVPTLVEAEDVLEMEEIERDLGF